MVVRWDLSFFLTCTSWHIPFAGEKSFRAGLPGGRVPQSVEWSAYTPTNILSAWCLTNWQRGKNHLYRMGFVVSEVPLVSLVCPLPLFRVCRGMSLHTVHMVPLCGMSSSKDRPTYFSLTAALHRWGWGGLSQLWGMEGTKELREDGERMLRVTSWGLSEGKWVGLVLASTRWTDIIVCFVLLQWNIWVERFTQKRNISHSSGGWEVQD
jgi:hypothetical protein